MKIIISIKKWTICLFLMLYSLCFKSEENSIDENKFIEFFKDKDNLGFTILISIAFVGFTFKIVDVILKQRKNKKEQINRSMQGHHHSQHHLHHHKHTLHHPKRKN